MCGINASLSPSTRKRIGQIPGSVIGMIPPKASAISHEPRIGVYMKFGLPLAVLLLFSVCYLLHSRVNALANNTTKHATSPTYPWVKRVHLVFMVPSPPRINDAVCCSNLFTKNAPFL